MLNNIYLHKKRDVTTEYYVEGLLCHEEAEKIGSKAAEQLYKEYMIAKGNYNNQCFSFKVCTCNEWKQWEIPCRHRIAFYFARGSIPIIPKGEIHPRHFWTFNKSKGESIVRPIDKQEKCNEGITDDVQNKINKLFETEDGLSSFFEFCDSFFKNKTYADDETGIKFPKQRKGRKEERVSQNCEPCKKLPKLPKLYVKDKTIQKDSKIEVSKRKSRSRTICSKCGRCHNKRKNGKCPSFLKY